MDCNHDKWFEISVDRVCPVCGLTISGYLQQQQERIRQLIGIKEEYELALGKLGQKNITLKNLITKLQQAMRDLRAKQGRVARIAESLIVVERNSYSGFINGECKYCGEKWSGFGEYEPRHTKDCELAKALTDEGEST
jgi:hypothetical protein